MSPITDFYKGKTVFVTGATGFMGKVLLEKLIRSLPDLEKVFILVRPKKGVTLQERVKALISNVIFTLNNIDQNALNKIEAISGDITKENFEMSEDDKQKIIEEVSVVFHLAASIRMDLGLKEAVLTNTKSTYELFKFCTNIKNLVSVVHLSTAFCNADVTYMEEKVYPSNVNPYQVIELVEWMDEKLLAAVETELISPHPNTYTFAKRLSEIIAMDMNDKLPLIVIRPSIVIPALHEPTPGWVDNYYGPIGLCVAIGKGILQSELMDADLCPQWVPVDIAINNLIVCAYERATQSYSEMPVVNVTNGEQHATTWRKSLEFLMNLTYKYPFKKMLWYPRLHSTKSYYLYHIYATIFHFIPALAIDFLLIMFLQKPFLTSIHRRLFMTSKILYHFTIRKWKFANTGSEKLMQSLNLEDKKNFPTDFVQKDSKQYLTDCFFCVRKYLVKEDTENIDIHRLLLKIFYVLDISLKALFSYYVAKMVWVALQRVFKEMI